MKLILQAIKALFRKIEASIDNAQTAADNAKSLADNAQTTADSKMSVTNPVGSGTFSMGRKSGSTVGAYSHAEGFVATASGAYSHAEGYTTTAEGAYSHAEGSYTTADGACSHAEGKSAKAHGDYSHAEGRITTASGESSHAEGCNTVANGMYSHSEGYYTKAGGRSQHVYGEYNINDGGPSPGRGKYVQIVGNGTSTSLRSNAHTLDWSGNAWFSGDVYVGSTSGTDKDDGSKKLATEEYVNNKVSDFGGIQSPTNAEVGQTIVVKSVDENGKPTEWEAVDVPSGGGEEAWDYEKTIVIEEEVASITIDTFDDGTPLALKKVEVILVGSNATSANQNIMIVSDVVNASNGGAVALGGGTYLTADKKHYLWGIAEINNGEIAAEFAQSNNQTQYVNFYTGISSAITKVKPGITYSTNNAEIYPNKATKFISITANVPAGAFAVGTTLRIKGVMV